MKEIKITEEELVLSPNTELYEAAQEIARKTENERKTQFVLHYDGRQKEFLLSMIEAVGGVVIEEGKEESASVTVLINGEQLKFLKALECMERVTYPHAVARQNRTEAVNASIPLTEKEENGIMAISEEPSEAAEATALSMPMRCVDGNSGCSGSNESCGGDGPCTGDSSCSGNDSCSGNGTCSEGGSCNGNGTCSGNGSCSGCSSCSGCCNSNTMETAVTIPDESHREGNVCCPGAEQWYKFTATRTGQYTIYTWGTADTDTIGTLYDSAGNEIIRVDDRVECGKWGFRIIINLTAGETYYVKVEIYGYNTGSYTLGVTKRVLADYVTINKKTLNLVKGVRYELPITPNYVYKGYKGAQRIPDLSVFLSPANATDQKIWWDEENGTVLECERGWDEDGDRYAHVIAKSNGTEKLYAEDWGENGKQDECTVTVSTPYCGGENYRDVTKHSMVLQGDGYYVCSKCGYRIKSPALQDREILNDEDYYTVLCCYLSMPYYKILEETESYRQSFPLYVSRVNSLKKKIDNVRSKSEYIARYAYSDYNGNYIREYSPAEADDFSLSVSYNVVNNLNLLLHNNFIKNVVQLISGFFIPQPYKAIFAAATSNGVYDDITFLLSSLAEQAKYEELGMLINFINLGCSADQEMEVTDKVIYISFTDGITTQQNKFVFSREGLLKTQCNSEETLLIVL